MKKLLSLSAALILPAHVAQQTGKIGRAHV